jgi:hypothetical protein
MEDSFQSKLDMYRAVKAVCDEKPLVWRRSEAFVAAFADFCGCVEKLIQWQPAVGIFNSVTNGIALEMESAELILTARMDELIEQFEPVDVAFVDDYTAARSREMPDGNFMPAAPRPCSENLPPFVMNGEDIVGRDAAA